MADWDSSAQSSFEIKLDSAYHSSDRLARTFYHSIRRRIACRWMSLKGLAAKRLIGSSDPEVLENLVQQLKYSMLVVCLHDDIVVAKPLYISLETLDGVSFRSNPILRDHVREDALREATLGHQNLDGRLFATIFKFLTGFVILAHWAACFWRIVGEVGWSLLHSFFSQEVEVEIRN